MLTLTAFLGAGGVHGIVVGKSYQPLPLVDSLGIDGIYRLELQGADKVVHRQMVSPEIFSSYQIGDEFDDRLSAADARKHHANQLAAEAKPAAVVKETPIAKAAPSPAPANQLVAKAPEAKPSPTAKPLAAAASPVPKPPDANGKLTAVFLKRDMLPDTEGF